jgi:preprotein translocase subunit SecG
MNRRILLAALVLALLLITVVVLAYVNQFGIERSASQDDWGQFGDYFAGLLNPIFSLLAFGALMYSLVLQHTESLKNQERFNAQHSIAKKEFDDYVKEKHASELLAVIRDIDVRLDHVLNAKVSQSETQHAVTVALMVAEGNRVGDALAQSDNYIEFIADARKNGTFAQALVRDLASLVNEMRDVLAQSSNYRGTAQAPLIVYYANKTYPLITLLEGAGAVDYTSREFFAMVSDKHH